MNAKLTQLLRIIFRRTGTHLLGNAEGILRAQIEAFQVARSQLHAELAQRAEENDKLREKIAGNTKANVATLGQIRHSNAVVDRLSNILNG